MSTSVGASKGIKYFHLVAVGFICSIALMAVLSNVSVNPKMIEGIRKRIPVFNIQYNINNHFNGFKPTCTDCITESLTVESNCPSCAIRTVESNCSSCAIRNTSFTSIFGEYVFPEPNCEGKLLVYECGPGLCGGLGDREKGIMTAFLLALLTGRTLVIDHRKPCDIKKFMEPNLYDWSKCMKDVGRLRPKGNRVVHYIDGKGSLPKDFSTQKSGDMWSEQVVTIHVNIRLQERIKGHPDAKKMLPWLMTSPPEKLITGLMHVLFKPEVSLGNYVEQFLVEQKRNRQFIAVHIRSAFLNKENDIPIIFKFLEQFSDKDKYCLYVASDNIEVRNKAMQTFPNFASVNREIVHIDQSNKPCDGVYTAVLEQQILSKADILVMTPSGFSRLAAYIRGVPNNIYLLMKEKQEAAVHFESIELKLLPVRYPVG